MVKILPEEFRMTAGTHIWTRMDHENDGFHSRNLNATTPISTYDKNRALFSATFVIG